jgi:hypothetical protein
MAHLLGKLTYENKWINKGFPASKSEGLDI